ncbi:hypothetical protein [uncultured Enterovirga sp.]|uniref:hypothetical protein n=1 Tax=uncultured Enterovirga sp. TaxID=2026352 RepID=UPI0035C97006
MAVRYRFTRDYDHPANSFTDKAYKAGTEDLIPEAHAAGADAVGAGTRLPDDKSDELKGKRTSAERG